MQTDRLQTVSRSAMAFLAGTALSRVAGMVRDMVMAFSFGAHPAIAAFMVAFRFANLFRRLLGEGQMPSGFVPYFEASRKEVPKKGALFFRDLFSSSAFALFLLVSSLEVLLYSLYMSGALSSASREILFLTMVMLPGVFFICLFGLTASLLQCERRYFLPGFAPVLFNCVWIGTALAWRGEAPESAAFAIALSVIFAFALQWLATLPPMWKYLRAHLSLREICTPLLFSSEIVNLLRPIAYGLIGVGAMQINSALDALFARAVAPEGPAYLWYAIRMEQLPLALFGVALSSALLPPLARAHESGDRVKYRELLLFALQRSFTWAFPCAVAILVLGAASVNLLYGRGGFSQADTAQTLLCLWGYGAGLLPAVFVLLLAPGFYARKDFRTPMVAALYSVLLNVALNALMVFLLGWGAFSVAIATSLAALFNCCSLAFHLARRVGPLFPRSQLVRMVKPLAAALLAGGALLFISHALVGDPTLRILMGQGQAEGMPFVRDTAAQLLHFFVLTGSFGLLLFSYGWMFSTEKIA